MEEGEKNSEAYSTYCHISLQVRCRDSGIFLHQAKENVIPIACCSLGTFRGN